MLIYGLLLECSYPSSSPYPTDGLGPSESLSESLGPGESLGESLGPSESLGESLGPIESLGESLGESLDVVVLIYFARKLYIAKLKETGISGT